MLSLSDGFAEAAVCGDGDDDFMSASSGSQCSDSPSPRTGSISGAFTLSPHARAGAAMAVLPDGRSLQLNASQQPSISVNADANVRNGSFHGGAKPALGDAATNAEQAMNGGSRNGSGSGGVSDIQPASPEADEPATVSADAAWQDADNVVSPTQPEAEAILAPRGMAPLQARHSPVPSKKARRVTWAAGVVSPRPRERRRKRRRRWLGGSSLDPDAAGGGTSATTGSFLLPCPPDDGELEGFGAARLARTAAAAMALWAHRASEFIFPLLLASLVTPPGGGHRLTRVPAAHGTMPNSRSPSIGFVADPGSSSTAGSGGAHSTGQAGGNPLLLAAQLAAAAAVVRLACGERLRSRTAGGSRAMAARRACTAHAAAACAAAVLLATACHLAPPPYARTGSGLGVIEGVLAAAAALAFGVAATGPDALQLGLQRDWLWELLPGGGGIPEPWPREQDVAQGLAVCELGGTLTGGLLLLLLGPVAAALAAAALHLAAWLGGAALLRRFRAATTPPGIGSLAAEIVGGRRPEVELSHTLSTVAKEQPRNGLNGHGGVHSFDNVSSQPELPLSYGGAAPTSDIEQQLPDQQPQQQNQNLSGHSSTEAPGSGSPQRRPRPLMRGCCGSLRAFWTDFQGWADQPAAPAAAAAALLHASILDLGVLMLAFLAAQGVPVVVVAAAAAAGALAAAAGGAFAPALAAKFGGLLPGGAVAAAAHMAAAWAAAAPLLAEKAAGAPHRWASDAVLVAALIFGAAARAAFSATVQLLMERWQEGGDAGGVGSVQRRLRGGCAAAAAVAALALASLSSLPWLMAASAAFATAAATVFAAFAAVEWKYCSPGGGLAPLAAAESSAADDAAADVGLETECLIP